MLDTRTRLALLVLWIFVAAGCDSTPGTLSVSGANLQTTEAGGEVSLQVTLSKEPSAPVTVALSSSATAEGMLPVAAVTLDRENWSSGVAVTLRGVDDHVDDGDRTYSLSAAASSEDERFDGVSSDAIELTNLDDDTAAIAVEAADGLATSEAGATAQISVQLATEPVADVVLTAASDCAGELQFEPPTFTFTSQSWDTAQQVTIIGLDDDREDGDAACAVTFEVATTDPVYAEQAVAAIPVANLDDDTAGILVVADAVLDVAETGTTATFTLRLRSEPTADVTFSFTSSNPAEGTVTPGVTFGPSDWSIARSITITGVDDAVDDGEIQFLIDSAPAESADPHYDGEALASVLVRNADDDTAGIQVTPTSGLLTTESGGTATFTVRLSSQPTAEVSLSLGSTSPGEASAAPGTLTFDASNWMTEQTVTVTGQDDDVADGTAPFTIALAALSSADPGYAGMEPADVAGDNSDDDVAGFALSATSGLTTTEAGGTASFTLRLTSQPTADVTIPVSSSESAEATVAPTSLTFTSANWSTPQAVTATGVDDADDDGDRPFTVVLSGATSVDGVYNTLDPTDPTGTNADDDAAGFEVTPETGLVTTEAGGFDSFTVRLTSRPSAPVQIDVSSDAPSEGSVSPAQLTFTSDNWNAPQAVTVTGVDDLSADGPVSYLAVLAAAVSGDTGYEGLDPVDVSVTNTDDETAGITVSPTSGLQTREEAGGTARFTVVLNSRPAADVTLSISSSDPGEGSAAPSSLTFTADNWNAPQDVTVTGADDPDQDGNQSYTILTAAAVSGDPDYDGLDPADVVVTNLDDETPGFTVSPSSGLVTTEAGGTATFQVRLNAPPTADVSIGLSVSDTAEGAVSPGTLIFTTANWNAPQTATVTGQDDALADGNQPYTVVTAAAVSSDLQYANLNPRDVAVTNTDDDSPGISVAPTEGLETTEAGGAASFTIVLNSEPTADVSVGLSSSDPGEATVSPASVTFTATNWNAPRTITVSGEDDALIDGSQPFVIVTAAASSADGRYSGMDAQDVQGVNVDDDSAGFTISPTSGLGTTEAGGTATFSVRLNSQPTDDVTLSVDGSAPDEVGAAPASLTFTSVNWNAPQEVTLTGQDDAVADGNQPFVILLGAAASADPDYQGLDPSDVTGSNLDDDSAGIRVEPAAVTTREGGTTAAFSVVLNSQPLSDVTLTLSSSDTGEASVTPSSLTFTSVNWNAPQEATVTGEDDAVQDGDQVVAIVTSLTTSGDPAYEGLDPADVQVTNEDDDSASIIVEPIADLTTDEGGGTAQFSVRLGAQPAADVTLPISSSDGTEGTASVTELVFTSADWDVAQQVTITGEDDALADGSQPYQIVTGAAASTDPAYSGLNPPNVSVINVDDDSAGFTITPPGDLVTTEGGGFALFTIRLNSQPSADVTVSLSSSDLTEGTVSQSSVTFTPGNWNADQEISVTGADDLFADGDQPYSVVTGAAVSTDPGYNGLNPADLTVTNEDDET